MPWAGFVKPKLYMENLGKHGKDVITGFEGTITSEHHYLTGCTQLGLQPKCKEDGTLGETMYFDETRVEVTGDVVELPAMQEYAKSNIPAVIKSVCDDCIYYLTCNSESRDKQICDNYDNEQ